MIPDLTPTRSMGKIVRNLPKAKRCSPQHHIRSVRFARAVRRHHTSLIIIPWRMVWASDSPLARIYGLGGYVLLLGVGHSNNTSIHLAEYRADFPAKRVVQEGAPISQTGSRTWATFEDVDVDDFRFRSRIGTDFLCNLMTGKVSTARQGRQSQIANSCHNLNHRRLRRRVGLEKNRA